MTSNESEIVSLAEYNHSSINIIFQGRVITADYRGLRKICRGTLCWLWYNCQESFNQLPTKNQEE